MVGMVRTAQTTVGARRGRVLAALALVGVTAALVSAVPASASVASPPAVHGMGAAPSGALILPGGLVRSLGGNPPLPASVDLSRYATKVGDQGSVNSCVAWTVGYAMMGWFSNSQGHAGAPYAPMYTYSQVTGGRNVGTSPVSVLEVLRTQGIDTAAHYALHHVPATLDWRHAPSSAEHIKAATNKITGWTSLYNNDKAPGAPGVAAVKRTLASGRPVALGIAVYDRFENAHGAGALVTSGGNLGALRGYHEVLAVGYSSRGIRVQNSWGTGWGDKGFATLDWNYLAQHSFEAETMSGLATTTGVNRPVIATVSATAGPVVTITGSKLKSAMITLGKVTIMPTAVGTTGTKLTFRVPANAAATSLLNVSTPGGISVTRTYRYVR